MSPPPVRQYHMGGSPPCPVGGGGEAGLPGTAAGLELCLRNGCFHFFICFSPYDKPLPQHFQK